MDHTLRAQITASVNKDGTTHANVAIYDGCRDIGWLFFQNGEIKKATSQETVDVWNMKKSELLACIQ